MSSQQPDAAVIEIVERTAHDPGDLRAVIPNEIRINGHPVLAPSEHPVQVHGITIDDSSAVLVTLTLFAKMVRIGHEAVEPEPGEPA